MKFLKQVRQKVFSALNKKITGVNTYYSGRPSFLDESEMPAIAVFIDEAQTEDSDLCGAYWELNLNVIAYQKSAMPEDSVDDLMEKIVARLQKQEFSEWENMELKSCVHTHDEQQAQWIAGVLQYKVGLYSAGEDNE